MTKKDVNMQVPTFNNPHCDTVELCVKYRHENRILRNATMKDLDAACKMASLTLVDTGKFIKEQRLVDRTQKLQDALKLCNQLLTQFKNQEVTCDECVKKHTDEYNKNLTTTLETVASALKEYT